MNSHQYLNYVDTFLAVTSRAPFYKAYPVNQQIVRQKDKRITGTVIKEDSTLRFYSPRNMKLFFELLEEPQKVQHKHTLNWINTRNRFLHHIMESLMVLQKEFWETENWKKLVPISFKGFTERYPFPYLDISRVNRLVKNTVISFNGDRYPLKNLFCSKKRIFSIIIEDVIRCQKERVKDREIQTILKQNYGVEPSVRTICNYRNSLHIPAYNRSNYSILNNYGFSKPVVLKKEILKLIPQKPGVYEISLPEKLRYSKNASNTVYFGCSKNLRARIQSYTYTDIKNKVVKRLNESYQLYIRYLHTHRYIDIENELLNQFNTKFGSNPIANRVRHRGCTIADCRIRI